MVAIIEAVAMGAVGVDQDTEVVEATVEVGDFRESSKEFNF